MATLDLAGIITRICTDLRAKFADKSVETSKQDLLVSGTNIKTVNSTSLLGSGNVSVQPTLVSGTNIKTINGTSLLGSGGLWIKGLPNVYAADNGKVLMVVDGTWQAVSLPLASDSTFGVVRVDGTTIMAANGVISTDAGIATSYEVTITLTNPAHASQFSRCEVWQLNNGPYEGDTVRLQDITSPTGSETYEIPATAYGLRVTPYGASPYGGSATCTGGVTYVSDDGNNFFFTATGDGTITIDGVDYDD